MRKIKLCVWIRLCVHGECLSSQMFPPPTIDTWYNLWW